MCNGFRDKLYKLLHVKSLFWKSILVLSMTGICLCCMDYLFHVKEPAARESFLNFFTMIFLLFLAAAVSGKEWALNAIKWLKKVFGGFAVFVIVFFCLTYSSCRTSRTKVVAKTSVAVKEQKVVEVKKIDTASVTTSSTLDQQVANISFAPQQQMPQTGADIVIEQDEKGNLHVRSNTALSSITTTKTAKKDTSSVQQKSVVDSVAKTAVSTTTKTNTTTKKIKSFSIYFWIGIVLGFVTLYIIYYLYANTSGFSLAKKIKNIWKNS